MLTYVIASPGQADQLTALRLEVLRCVNHLPETHAFPDADVQAIHAYWQQGDHITVLALDDGTPIACATLCCIHVMPTFDHPTGRRGHVMNVYTRPAYRRQGIAKHMLCLLMNEARARGLTELTLDATDAGRPLYEGLGFHANHEGMVITL